MGKHIRYYSKSTNLDQLWCWSQPLDLVVDIRYHLPDSSETIIYILLLKIHMIDGSSKSTMKKHQMSLACMAFWRVSPQRRAVLRRSMALVLSKELWVWPPKMENRKTCGSGVPNLLRHELTSLTSWPMHFRFSGFLVLWWPSKSLRNWLFGSSWLSKFTCFTNMFLQTGYSNSSIFTFQEVPCWNEIRSYSSIMTFQQDHDVTQ